MTIERLKDTLDTVVMAVYAHKKTTNVASLLLEQIHTKIYRNLESNVELGQLAWNVLKIVRLGDYSEANKKRYLDMLDSFFTELNEGNFHVKSA